jgi:hypothetical protein
MLEKIKTWLPIFGGFYGSGLEDDNDMEYTLFNDPDSKSMLQVHKDFLVEECTDYIDYSDYHKEMADAICEAISEELESHNLISDYKFEALSSPKYYNFRNDSIDVEFEVDIIDLIEKCKIDIIGFELYLKDHYTSYDGFSSSYSNDPSDWFGLLDDYTDGIIMNDTAHCIGAILNFLLQGENYGCYSDIICESACEVPIYDYFNCDKLLEAFNEEFGLDADSLACIESGDINEVDPEVIARRDITGQKYFSFYEN